ncbi:MAG: acid stress-induced BolA-like protein IbaG/YrbA [Cellvibrionaceae bacterium]|jgi:acid stress-induced BolA-like protein IbaG/YrbA
MNILARTGHSFCFSGQCFRKKVQLSAIFITLARFTQKELIMDIQAIKALLLENFPGAHIEAETEGSHLNLVIVSDAFSGLSRVKKQQKVLAVLNEKISSGEVHAVNMKTLTPDQWQG